MLYCVYNLAVPGLSWACCTVSTLCQDRCEYTVLGQVWVHCVRTGVSNVSRQAWALCQGRCDHYVRTDVSTLCQDRCEYTVLGQVWAQCLDRCERCICTGVSTVSGQMWALCQDRCEHTVSGQVWTCCVRTGVSMLCQDRCEQRLAPLRSRAEHDSHCVACHANALSR